MGILIFLLLLAIPVAELWFIVQVADGIGVLRTILLLFLVSIAGAWLLKHQGLATWRRMRETLEQGQMPAKEVMDGALILLGGALLLTPGFLTDIVGLVLLFPVSRAGIKGVARKYLARRAKRRGVARRRPGTYEATVVKVERNVPTKDQNVSPGQLLSEERRSGEGDSPDTR